MINKIIKLKKIIKYLSLHNKEDLYFFKIKYLGKKGILNSLFKDFKKIHSKYEKKKIGKILNELKKNILEKINNNKKINKSNNTDINFNTDITLPGKKINYGSIHPISIIEKKILKIFNNIGFNFISGQEIEDDWHNFTALNFEKDHPSRDMQDTFFFKKNNSFLLRTHTSSVQIRYMKKNTPPIRIISSGKVYRNETISAKSNCMFHQIEGLCVDKKISFLDLKKNIEYFIKNLFGNKKIRIRPSYFPFTEPSLEIDVLLGKKKKNHIKMTKGTGWLEIMGCGMVDPNVLKNVNIDPNIYSGYAFGLGIERIAILYYEIDDIRMFLENDLRFLKQFNFLNY
ncbi:phenylalanine--tRNA ligase subunit alpha [Candidatus Shikimatogenerans silvanidophilus]|uniref:phenylalanine--tRNA ligase subunit alpha n=1 Tax=Candidatus Shikimatogenerans silvanidophilus TaxID=2782547 RepID=UPI001BA7F93D|nr:phenylalanine--tRNA ligase subunit alpha [Candidatus Shikimatogenerans silvanidophilus]